jgi:hypothetical protein
MNLRLTLLISVIILFCGCSGNANQNPMSPEGGMDSEISALPIIAPYETNGTFSATGLMGLYEMTINPDDLAVELVPSRSLALGESYIVSGTAFFTMTPCHDCLKFKTISLDENGNIVLGMFVKHPFPKGDPLKPPSAVNRLDLDVFDLALLVESLDAPITSYPLLGLDATPGILVNADGITIEMANVTGNANGLPFKICYESSDNNRFQMGVDYQPFDLVFAPGTGLTFKLYLTMGYGASAKKSQRLDPVYYVPEFNRKAAWKVVVVPPNGDDPPSILNTWNDKDTTTEHTISIDIYDWNHGATIAPEYPDPLNTNYISAESNVGSVLVEVPGMTASYVTAITSDTTTNGWDDPLTYTASFANENGLTPGEYYGIVKVIDTRSTGTSVTGGEADTLVHTPNGINLEWYNITEFATYQAFKATIVVGCGPITGQIVSGCPTEGIAQLTKIDFVVTASSGNGGDPITLYEIDWNYNGTNFVASDSNTDGVFNDTGPFTVPDPCEDNIPYYYTVAFRATDSCDPPNQTIFATCEITIDECCPDTTGDLSVIAINRGEGGVDPQRITSLDFDWDDHPCAVEYVVQRADGYSDTPWTDIDTTTSSFYKFLPTGVDLDDDIRFRVIARDEVGGNPLTDYGPSEEVFVQFLCNGGTMTGNLWNMYQEGMEFRFASWWGSPATPDVDDWPVGSSRNFIGLYYRNYASSLNAWAITHSKQIPDLEGQKEAFCSGYWITNYPWTTTMGMCIGTLSSPAPSGTTVCDFNAANTPYGTGLTYNQYQPSIDTEFCETDQDSWLFTQGTWYPVGYYLNDLCDDGPRDYIAFGWSNGDSINVSWVSGYMDGFVFIVD